MPGFKSRTEFTGLEDANRIAQRVRNLGEDNRPLLEIAASALEKNVSKRFRTGVGVGGVPWPISRRIAATAVGKDGPRRPQGHTLVDTGKLQDSIATEIRPNEVEIGSRGLDNPAKLYNQFGSARPVTVATFVRTVNSAFGVPLPEPKRELVSAHIRQTNLPARPFVGFDDDDKRDITEGMLKHLKGLFPE